MSDTRCETNEMRERERCEVLNGRFLYHVSCDDKYNGVSRAIIFLPFLSYYVVFHRMVPYHIA